MRKVAADAAGTSGEGEAFVEEVYDDFDHEWLYELDADDAEEGLGAAQGAARPLDIEHWFMPIDETSYVHPYAVAEATRREDAA
ncbi:hypothetical protein [Streptomyces lydicus]|uniref:hypothetical protein n=1 Tax=Streptomyces lydicus TaxID=47763 RepID=UPI0036EC19D0